ncbi:hypothetical protein [Enterococcus sp. AZ196]|uniref:hypothetical protein n=1 Tax=Enterococcus sp. AZ196 TaxID=2774659 RepID=UPI003D2C3BBB
MTEQKNMNEIENIENSTDELFNSLPQSVKDEIMGSVREAIQLDAAINQEPEEIEQMAVVRFKGFNSNELKQKLQELTIHNGYGTVVAIEILNEYGKAKVNAVTNYSDEWNLRDDVSSMLNKYNDDRPGVDKNARFYEPSYSKDAPFGRLESDVLDVLATEKLRKGNIFELFGEDGWRIERMMEKGIFKLHVDPKYCKGVIQETAVYGGNTDNH